MKRRRALKIASRINVLLMRELGQGVDPARMVADALYARDVLLVCETFETGDLALLARQFRAAIAAADDEAAGRESGFRASRFLSSIFGAEPGPDPARDAGNSRSNSASRGAGQGEK